MFREKYVVVYWVEHEECQTKPMTFEKALEEKKLLKDRDIFGYIKHID